MLSSLSIVVAPFLVKWITSGIKKFSMIKFSGYKTIILRFIVAILSFGSVVAYSILNGKEVDIASVQTLVDSFLVFMSGSGLYFWQAYNQNK